MQLYKPSELLADNKPSGLKPKYSDPEDVIYFPTKMVQHKYSKCIGKWNNKACHYAKKEEPSTSTSKTTVLTGIRFYDSTDTSAVA